MDVVYIFFVLFFPFFCYSFPYNFFPIVSYVFALYFDDKIHFLPFKLSLFSSNDISSPCKNKVEVPWVQDPQVCV